MSLRSSARLANEACGKLAVGNPPICSLATVSNFPAEYFPARLPIFSGTGGNSRSANCAASGMHSPPRRCLQQEATRRNSNSGDAPPRTMMDRYVTGGRGGPRRGPEPGGRRMTALPGPRVSRQIAKFRERCIRCHTRTALRETTENWTLVDNTGGRMGPLAECFRRY
jgi:hypothetical protein